MKENHRTYWSKWKQNAKERLIVLCIAVPMVAASIAFDVPSYVWDWIAGLLGVVACVYALCMPWLISPSRRENEESAARFAAWKRRMQDATDNVDMSGCDLTFDELWEYLDDEELAQIERELEKMPPGRRILRHAYQAVMRRREKKKSDQ